MTPLRVETRVFEPGDNDCWSDGAWDELLFRSSANTIFLTSGWLRAWRETLGIDARLIVPYVYCADRLIAAAAFADHGGVLELAGKGPSDYADVIVADGLERSLHSQAVGLLFDAATRAAVRFRRFDLYRVPAESRNVELLCACAAGLIPTVTGAVDAPFLDMKAVHEKLNKKSLKRHERGLEKVGELTSKTYTRAEDILPRLNPFFAQHVARWANTPHPSLFLSVERREFYRAVTRTLDSTGSLRFTVLNLDGRLIAAHFGFLHAHRFIWYKPSFDPELARLSPGEVLIKRLLEQARDEDAQEFDFTIGDEAFKLRFATGVRRVHYVHVTRSKVAARLRRARVALGDTRRMWSRAWAAGE